MKILLIPFFIIFTLFSCADWTNQFNKDIYNKSANLIVNYHYISVAHEKDFAIVGINNNNQRDTCYFSYIGEVIINLRKRDHLIKQPNSGLFIIIRPNNVNLKFNYELIDKAIYCNGKLEHY